jgi:hypothetical protein
MQVATLHDLLHSKNQGTGACALSYSGNLIGSTKQWCDESAASDTYMRTRAE